VVQDGSQKLYFNKSGEKASFIGQRLTDNRKERGVATEGEMTKEEKQQVPPHVYQHDTHTTHTAHTHSDPERVYTHHGITQNMIMVIQVPLKQAEQPRTHTFFSPPYVVLLARPLETAASLTAVCACACAAMHVVCARVRYGTG
jgi:hypothetical protein